MGGTSMAVARWQKDSFYVEKVFAGTTLDIGGAGDCIARYRAELPNLGTVTGLDLDRQPDGLTDTEWLQMPATQQRAPVKAASRSS